MEMITKTRNVFEGEYQQNEVVEVVRKPCGCVLHRMKAPWNENVLIACGGRLCENHLDTLIKYAELQGEDPNEYLDGWSPGEKIEELIELGLFV